MASITHKMPLLQSSSKSVLQNTTLKGKANVIAKGEVNVKKLKKNDTMIHGFPIKRSLEAPQLLVRLPRKKPQLLWKKCHQIELAASPNHTRSKGWQGSC